MKEKRTDTLPKASEDTRPWYGVCRTRRVKLPNGGTSYELDSAEFCCLGPNPIPDFLAEQRAADFSDGFWIVCSWFPATKSPLPDWGSLVVRGPGSWVLRSRDGRQMWATGRNGATFCLRGGES